MFNVKWGYPIKKDLYLPISAILRFSLLSKLLVATKLLHFVKICYNNKTTFESPKA